MSRFRTVMFFFFLAIVLTALSCGSEEAPRTPVPTIAPTALPTSTSVPTPTAVPVSISDTTSTSDGTAMHLGGLTRTGEFDTKPATKGEIKWKFKANPNMVSSPVVANGVAYFGASTYLYAVDTETGEQLWRFDTNAFVVSSPTVSDEVVYFGNLDGDIYAVDATSGEERWKFETGGEIQSSPAVSDGVVLVSSRNTFLFALDATTGDEKWRFGVESLRPPPWHTGILYKAEGWFASPAVAEGLVIIGAPDGYFHAVDIETGDERWNITVGKVYRIEFNEPGETIFHSMLPVLATPAIANGLLYVPDDWGWIYSGTQRSERSLVAISVETGSEEWRFPLQCYYETVCGTQVTVGSAHGVALSDNVAYVSTFHRNISAGSGVWHNLTAIDLETRRVVWQTRLSRTNGENPYIIRGGGDTSSTPTIAGPVIYVGNGPRNLHAVLKATGDVLWEVKTEGAVKTSAFVHDGVVYFTSTDGYLYAVE